MHVLAFAKEKNKTSTFIHKSSQSTFTGKPSSLGRSNDAQIKTCTLTKWVSVTLTFTLRHKHSLNNALDKTTFGFRWWSVLQALKATCHGTAKQTKALGPRWGAGTFSPVRSGCKHLERHTFIWPSSNFRKHHQILLFLYCKWHFLPILSVVPPTGGFLREK